MMSVVVRSPQPALNPGSPFPVGVIYGDFNEYASADGTPKPPYRNPQALATYYQAWLDGAGTATRSAVQVTSTRVGVSVDNLANCGADYASDPAGCFTSDHLTAWEPSPAWTGTVDFSVPMLSRKAVPEPYSSHSALKTIKRNLEWGAYGTGTSENPGPFPYASNYQNLARALVSDNLSHSYIDIGVESEGDWNPTQFGPDPTAWAQYYDHIQMTMSGVPGAHFRFVWTTGLFVSTTATDGTTKVSPEAAYPGDQAVNVVALDWYDANFGQVQINGRSSAEPYPPRDCAGVLPASCQLTAADWAQAWNGWYLPATNTAYYVYGLNWWAQFAEVHSKQIAFSAWGLSKAGDDAYLIPRVWLWLKSLPPGTVAFATYSNDGVANYYTNPHGPFAGVDLSPQEPNVANGTIYTYAPCEYQKWFGEQRNLTCPTPSGSDFDPSAPY